MKIRPVGDELSHADGGTERHDEANSCLPQVLGTRLKMFTSTLFYVTEQKNTEKKERKKKKIW